MHQPPGRVVTDQGESHCQILRASRTPPIPASLACYLQRHFFHSARETHPDKGGDVAAFLEARAAFEVLRKLYETAKVQSFAASGGLATASTFDASVHDFEVRHLLDFGFWLLAYFRERERDRLKSNPLPAYTVCTPT